MSDPEPTRRPYHGSCHCGNVRYITYLTLPPQTTNLEQHAGKTRISKCNCTTCHKTGFFHISLADAPNDFVLLSPTNPYKDLRVYRTGSKMASFFFCGTCGVRCFMYGVSEDSAETTSIDLEEWMGKESQGKLTEVWRPKKEGYVEEKTAVLRVNATSLDAGQEGLDLREWHERGWIRYANALEKDKEKRFYRFGEPFLGGCY